MTASDIFSAYRVNTVPDGMVNMEMVSPMIPTHAGLHRATSPGAGASTHHYGIHGKALDIITAGSEITINYGDWDFDSEDEKLYQQKPSRNVQWLQQHGWCIDQIEIARSTIPHAGRGAFARMPLSRGTVVAPAPLQVFKDRKIFQSTSPEQLYVNYCLQPKDSTMLLFPYGQGVNLINHSYRQPNVEWRWSTKTNHMHHSQWFDLSHDEFWNMVSPGSLILEVVALRDIGEGEELFINYGSS
jgi:SET domain